jgi:FkbM family methyltransferase|tara:strand:- start:1262 stop:1951 length:690 start_codon:yes stop_codon:yes gene_type:complete
MIKLLLKKILLLRLTFFKKIDRDFYSQFGEDKILLEIIPKQFTNGFYVDVGCFHPKKYSNTYMLFKKGWKGINIDMEKDKIESFDLARPTDYNFLGAISDKSEKVKIYRNQKFGVSSTLNENFIKKEDIIDEDYIQTTTLNVVLENSPFKGKKIDFLNIDTEGNDLKVLKSLDFDIYNPSIIIVETHLKKIDEIINSEIYLFLTNQKYILKSWNIYSLIFIKESYYEDN